MLNVRHCYLIILYPSLNTSFLSFLITKYRVQFPDKISPAAFSVGFTILSDVIMILCCMSDIII